jgi:UDP-GlcNAc:undecaprenyl-phosphate GlcNAc-1-phosphate transferase
MIQFEPRSNGEMTSILIPIFVMSVPILDVSVAVTSRIMRKVSPFQGGKDHLAHRLQRIGYSRKIAALALWLIEVFFCCISLAINFSKGETRDLLAFFGLGSLTLLYLTFVKLPFDGKKNF